MQPPILVFDIETIPDIETGRRLYPKLADLNDDEAITQMIALRESEVGNPFMPLPLHKIACLSVLWVANGQLTLKTLSLQDHQESEILQTFFNAIDKLPTLVSWNGKGFDLPVMLYRALQHGLSAPKLLSETGDMKYNNYLNRYHERHTDLMVKLAMGSTHQKLDIVASLCGFAGKQDIDGYQVVPMVQAGEWDKLTTYCESDVLNTWLIYLRYQRLLGRLTASEHEQWEAKTHRYLSELPVPIPKTVPSTLPNSIDGQSSDENASTQQANSPDATTDAEASIATETVPTAPRHAKFLAVWQPSTNR